VRSRVLLSASALLLALIDLLEQIEEIIRHRLPRYVVVHATQLAADGSLASPDGTIPFPVRFLFFPH
jgi:hypothetical protein